MTYGLLVPLCIAKEELCLMAKRECTSMAAIT